MDSKLEKMLQQPLFDALSEEELADVSEIVHIQHYPAGSVVFRQGDEADRFFLISVGQFEILYTDDASGEKGVARPLNILFPREFFGDISFYTGEPRGVTIRAQTDAEVLFIYRDDFMELVGAYPKIAIALDRLGEEIEERSLRRFEGQGENEVILYFERRHWIALVQRLSWVLLFLLLWFFGLLAGYALFRDNLGVQETIVVIGMLLLLIPLGRTVWEVLDWWNDYFIVTNERVIHIERVIGVMAERYEAPLSKVQNVNVAQPTPVGEILGYGKIIIATAAQGQVGSLVMDKMPNATVVAERIIYELNLAQGTIAQEAREEKRQAIRQALGFEPGDGAAAATQSPAPPPAPPDLWDKVSNSMVRLLSYLRPTMREQTGTTIVWRKHWIILLLHSLPAYASLTILVGLLFFIQITAQLSARALMTTWGIGTLLLLLNIFWIAWLYADWRNDLYILTADAILDEEKLPFGFNKEVRRASLDSIQDISYVQPHPLMVWAGVGNVQIQTAGQQGKFTFDWVQDPRAVQYDIYQYIQARQRKRQKNEAAAMSQELLEMLKLYDEEKRREAHARPTRPLPPEPGLSDPDATKPSDSV